MLLRLVTSEITFVFALYLNVAAKFLISTDYSVCKYVFHTHIQNIKNDNLNPSVTSYFLSSWTQAQFVTRSH